MNKNKNQKASVALLLSILGFAQVPTQAQEKQCSAENLTAECRAFDSMPSTIVLPDGTSYNNPRKPPVNTHQYTSTSTEKLLEMQDNLLGFQADLLKSIEKVPVSEKFKSSLANLFYLSIDLSESGVMSVKKTTYPSTSDNGQQFYPVNVSWPPDDPKAKLQSRSSEEVLDFLNKSLPIDAKKILKKMSDTRVSFYAGDLNQTPQNSVKSSIVTEARKKRINELVKFAKESIVRTLTGGRDPKLLTPEMHALMQKIQSVEYNDEVSSSAKKMHCSGGPNAFYNPTNNKFEICDSMMNFPDSQLITVIGHEIGHSIDPCFGTSGVQQINSKLLSSYLNMPSPILTSAERELLKYIGDSKVSALNWDYYFSPEILAEFKKVELFTPKFPAISIDKYPLLSVRNCIVSGSKLRSISKDKIPKMVDELALDRKKGEGIKTSDAEKKDYIDRFQKFPDCISDFGKSSEVAESMSDLIGANVFADYLKQNPANTEEERIGAFSYFLQAVCDINQLQNKYNSSIKRTPSVADLQEEIKKKSFLQVDPHARDLVRINELFLSQPEVAAAFNCKPHSNSECYKKFPTKIPGLEPLKISAPVVDSKNQEFKKVNYPSSTVENPSKDPELKSNNSTR